MTSARHKLNELHCIGSFVVAAFIGAIFESWTVFVIVAVMMIVGSLHSGDIRPTPHRIRR